MGRLLAVELAPYHSVSLYDASTMDDPRSTGLVAAAMLAPTAESVIASQHISEMGKVSLNLWRRLLQHYQRPDLLQQAGTVVLSHPQDQNELQHFVNRLKHTQSSQLQHLTHMQLSQMEPELAEQFLSAVYLQGEGQLDNQGLFQMLSALIREANVQLYEQHPCEVSGNCVVSGGERTSFDWVIDCRGLGAKDDFSEAQTPLRGVRGEVIRVRAPEVSIQRPVRLMHPRYPLYVVPKPDDQYVIGATEIESDCDSEVTVRSAMELLSAAYSVHRGFAEAQLLNAQAGLRPALADNEPAIIKRGELIQVNGLYRHGFMIAPYLLCQILSLIEQPTAVFNSLPEIDREVVTLC